MRTSTTTRTALALAAALLLAACATGGSPAGSSPSSSTSTSPTGAVPSPSTTPTDATPHGIVHASPVTYRITYSITLRSTGFRLTRVRIWLPNPGTWKGQQTTALVSVKPRPTKTATDPVTQTSTSYWSITKPPKKGVPLTITATWKVTVMDTRTFLGAADVRPYDTSTRTYRLYTKAEPYLEVADPLVRSTAAKVVGVEQNPLLRARLIYDYVLRRMTYVESEGDLVGAKKALVRGTGDCSEYTALFVALARAAGIPARPVVGWAAYTGDSQGHSWAEFWLDGWGWVPVDPTWGDDANERDYWFGSSDSRRVAVGRGFSTHVTPAFPDGSSYPEAVGAAWWYWGYGDEDAVDVSEGRLVVEPVV